MRKTPRFHLNNYLSRVGSQVNAALDRFIPDETVEPPTIHKAMRYSLLAGGKRIRPVLCLAACDAVGGKTANAMPLACAVECIHTYSLIHDDLPCMDDDDLRRGKPTNHKVFGEGIAVLAGDALLTQAFELVALAKPPRRHDIATMVRELAFAAGSLRLIAGQVQDLENENRRASLDEVRTTHMNKTAALITASIRLGAMAGNATAPQLGRLTKYGQDLGLAFQIIDDVLDATSTKEAMGKSVRADQKHQKSTYASALGVDKSRALAARLIADAHKQLVIFGDRATPLRVIADFFLTRKH
ncbi:MAG: polyprenyl synthetase family protein [Verrucomicrobia bacterium]|nr:polyprenyl synthetase family protein [Verrucomicrobiota bacterium]